MANVFFSYSHDDELYRDQLEKHLAAMRHQGLIESWHDRRILPGADLDQQIDHHLGEAEIILLLVSSSFLASRYCYGIEMAHALERHRAGTAKVIPVIVRPCDWQSTPIGGLLAVPTDGKAVSTWTNFDEAYLDITRQLRRLVQDMTPAKATAAVEPAQRPGTSQAAAALPRSSNLRLRKDFTEADKDKYLHESFDFMAQFFEGSLRELETRNADIETRFRRVDANTFTATVYRGGAKTSECAVVLGGGFRSGGISYSHDANARGNSYNEMLTVANDEQTLYLKPMGMGMSRLGNRDNTLSPSQAAEYYWDMLISHLQ